MNDSEDFDRLEKYLFGQMTEEEIRAFEKELATDARLKEQLALHRLEHQAMDLDIKASLRADLAEWKKEKTNPVPIEHAVPEKSAKITRFRKYIAPMAIAASIALVLSFWFLTNQYSNSALSNNYFTESSQVSRGLTPGSIPEILIPGWNALRAGDYERAIQLLEVIQDENYVDQARLMIGEAYFKMDRLKLAADTFQQVLGSSDFANFRDQAEWQLGLTYLADKSTASQGEALIEAIANNPDHSHFPDAKALLKKKASFWGKWF